MTERSGYSELSEHPDDLLSALADDELDELAAAEVESHLVVCERCRDELAEVERVRGAVQVAGLVPAPDGLVEGLIQRRRRASRRGAILGTAAAIVALAASVTFADPAADSPDDGTRTRVLANDVYLQDRIARFGGDSIWRHTDDDDSHPTVADRAAEAARDLLGFLSGD